MQFKHCTLDFDGPVAVVKLDHQEVMNAVSMDMLAGLAEADGLPEEPDADRRDDERIRLARPGAPRE